MKKLNFIVALIALFGQIAGVVGLFVSETNNQLMLSLWTFLGFACIGAISLITDKKVNERIM